MLVIFNQIIGGFDFLSGGERITVELLRRWKRFMDIAVMLPENGLNLIKTKEKLDVNYITLPLTFLDKSNLYWRYIFLIPLVWVIYTLRACAKISKIDIKDKRIYSAGDLFCNIIPAFLKKVKDKKTIWIVSIFHIIESPFKRKAGYSFLSNCASHTFQKFSLWLIKKRADRIFVLNEDVKAQLIKIGFDKNIIYVSGAGIDFGYIDAVFLNKDAVYDGCFMARLSPTKGIYDIPNICKGVVKERGDFRLVIIGDGNKVDENKFRFLISRYDKNKQITLVGRKEGKDKYSLMKSSKVFVFPSYEEGFALSILEAMACKIPVIAWDLPVYKTIYKDVIITVPKGNIVMFAEKILGLLSDEKLRIMYAERGYNLARQYDWDIIAQKAFERINNINAT